MEKKRVNGIDRRGNDITEPRGREERKRRKYKKKETTKKEKEGRRAR